MLTFGELQGRLLEYLKFRVRNGELTERGLARMIGVSQPHIHNVLKGVRTLSPEVGDQILVHLRISLIDFVQREELTKRADVDGPSFYESCYIPVLAGAIGPGQPWPWRVEPSRRFLIDRSKIANFLSPIICRIGPDSRMAPALQEGDFGLLDQSRTARENTDPSGLYLIKSGNQALVRRVRRGSAQMLYLVTEDSISNPAGWQTVRLEDKEIAYVIRARVYLVAPDDEGTWKEKD